MNPKLKNLSKAALRIKEAIKNGEKMVIYADSDMDGVSSAIIVKESICNVSYSILEKDQKLPQVSFYFPNRKTEGYGLNSTAVDFLNDKFGKDPLLLITLDCGITNYEEVKKARSFGFSVMIVDHHQVVDGKMPKANIIVDPNQKGDRSFNKFANAGLAFRLAEELLGGSMSQCLRRSFLELAALATIADMMPEIEDNSEIIVEGLSDIEHSQRPGVKVFFEIFNAKDFSSRRDLISKIISVMNVASVRDDHQHDSYFLLTTGDQQQARLMADLLLEKSIRHHEEIKGLEEEVKFILINKASPIVFEGSKNWDIELLGAVASRILNQTNKPVFLYTMREETSRGSVRAPKGMDVVKAMAACADLLEMFGGHPPAAGFTVKNENLEKFKESLIEYFSHLKP